MSRSPRHPEKEPQNGLCQLPADDLGGGGLVEVPAGRLREGTHDLAHVAFRGRAELGYGRFDELAERVS